ncbi:hypothetical protein K438DRAFT_1968430 [Mycena galopus ATCC 62051]|nr:hypothetical protein K438DRAFT_1968430 [Mycena galopus ATCC 62051]
MNSHVQIKPEDNTAEYRFPPTPPFSPPSSDSGRTTPSEGSDWSQFSSPAQSPIVSSPVVPYARLARSVRGTERARQRTEIHTDRDAAVASLLSHYRSQMRPPTPPAAPLPPSSSRRIPRPPNAFILYRSDLLKTGMIPDNVERRQQNLSRVAGECWNLLSAAEKKVWQDLALERAARHAIDYPGYHFKPSPRGKAKAKPRANDASDANGDDLIRALRETYVGITGPSICSSRGKKPKAPVSDHINPTDAYVLAQSLPCTPAVSPISTQDLGAYSWTCASASTSNTSNSPPPSLPSPEPTSSQPSLPPFFPQRTFPHFPAPRRPSTSLGFVRKLNEDTSCPEGPERPASASSETGLTNLVRDFSITPTTANFGHIAMPAPSEWTPWPTVDQPQALRSTFSFAALNAHPTDPVHVQPSVVEESGPFTDEQFMMTLDAFTNDPHPGFSFDNWTFDGANDLTQ